MATHTGTWKDERAAIASGDARVKLVDVVSGEKFAIVDFAGASPFMETDDVVTVTDLPDSLPNRHYKITSRADLAVDMAVRCLAVPTPAP